MPITIKSTELKYKNPSTGQYQGIDAVAETTTSQQCALIEAKGAETIASIPSDYTTLSDTVDDLNGAINAITPLDTVPTNGSTKGITSDAVFDALPKEEAVDWFDVNTATVSTNSLFAKRYGKVIVLNGYLTMNGTVAGNGADLGSFSDIAPTATQKISGFGTYNGGFSVISLSFNSNGHISTQTGSGTFTGVIYLPNTALI